MVMGIELGLMVVMSGVFLELWSDKLDLGQVMGVTESVVVQAEIFFPQSLLMQISYWRRLELVALEPTWQVEPAEMFVIFGENWTTALPFLVGSVVLGSQEAVRAVKFRTFCLQSQALEMEWEEP